MAQSNSNRTRITLKHFAKSTQNVPEKSYPANSVFQDGMSDSTMMLWLHLPWICSVIIMTITIAIYFWIHPWPTAFTETVLGIIIGGTSFTGSSTAFSLVYKKRKLD